MQFRDGAGNVSETARDTIVLDTKAPRAKKSLPADAARQVGPGARLKVWATERLAPSTVDASTVKLTQGGDPVVSQVSYAAQAGADRRRPEAAPRAGYLPVKVTTQSRTSPATGGTSGRRQAASPSW